MNKRNLLSANIIVSALGYFVDVYDLVLFSVVRVASLQSLGLDAEAQLREGLFLLNVQNGGLLLGGILWGVWGDKRGRISVLFGSIFLYSIANICNGFVNSVDMYAVCRFFAGVGLAGELGAGITLVSESLDKEVRGIGTTIVATVGVAGAVVAAGVGDFFSWRHSYWIGGGLGMMLLFLRVAAYESGLYQSLQTENVAKGNLILLFSSGKRAMRYLACVLTGMPIWYLVGILVTLSPEIAKALEIPEKVSAGSAIFYTYIGFVVGDLTSGLLSQFLKSRKKVLALFILLTAISASVYLTSRGVSAWTLYYLCTALGFAGGYWAVFVSTAAEQFGTNLRATVTTTVPNFVRGSIIPLTILFNWLKPSMGVLESAGMVGALTIVLAVIGLIQTEESFGRDLDFVER